MEYDYKRIYILLSKTETIPSNLIKLFTGEPYSHTSLALDISLNEMYSFARRGMYNPFNGGFISENIEKGIFGKHKETRCTVYELNVTKRQYDHIQRELVRFKKHPERYGYNFLGVFSVFFHRAMDREYNYFCSQFVAAVLRNAEVDIFHKKPGLVKPGDFRKCTMLKPVFTGRLADYRAYLHEKYKHRHGIDNEIGNRIDDRVVNRIESVISADSDTANDMNVGKTSLTDGIGILSWKVG